MPGVRGGCETSKAIQDLPNKGDVEKIFIKSYVPFLHLNVLKFKSFCSLFTMMFKLKKKKQTNKKQNCERCITPGFTK